MTDVQLANTQAAFIRSQDEARARAMTGSPTPSVAQVEQAHRTNVAAESSIRPPAPVSWWGSLTPAQRATWTTDANNAINAIVAYATAHYPDLALTNADFVVDFAGVEGRGANVQAFGAPGGVAGRILAHVGRGWVEMVKANPAYGMSIVVHELHGHPEFGGTMGTTYPAALYSRALGRPMTPAEIDTFGYEDTEIYSLLRSMPYHTGLAPADVALRPYEIDPAKTVEWHLRQIKTQWEPSVARALATGLYRRLVMDPRIVAAALHAYESAVRAVFPAPDATTILR
jgi:hypothetical protein